MRKSPQQLNRNVSKKENEGVNSGNNQKHLPKNQQDKQKSHFKMEKTVSITKSIRHSLSNNSNGVISLEKQNNHSPTEFDSVENPMKKEFKPDLDSSDDVNEFPKLIKTPLNEHTDFVQTTLSHISETICDTLIKEESKAIDDFNEDFIDGFAILEFESEVGLLTYVSTKKQLEQDKLHAEEKKAGKRREYTKRRPGAFKNGGFSDSLPGSLCGAGDSSNHSPHSPSPLDSGDPYLFSSSTTCGERTLAELDDLAEHRGIRRQRRRTAYMQGDTGDHQLNSMTSSRDVESDDDEESIRLVTPKSPLRVVCPGESFPFPPGVASSYPESQSMPHVSPVASLVSLRAGITGGHTPVNSGPPTLGSEKTSPSRTGEVDFKSQHSSHISPVQSSNASGKINGITLKEAKHSAGSVHNSPFSIASLAHSPSKSSGLKPAIPSPVAASTPSAPRRPPSTTFRSHTNTPNSACPQPPSTASRPSNTPTPTSTHTKSQPLASSPFSHLNHQTSPYLPCPPFYPHVSSSQGAPSVAVDPFAPAPPSLHSHTPTPRFPSAQAPHPASIGAPSQPPQHSWQSMLGSAVPPSYPGFSRSCSSPNLARSHLQPPPGLHLPTGPNPAQHSMMMGPDMLLRAELDKRFLLAQANALISSGSNSAPSPFHRPPFHPPRPQEIPSAAAALSALGAAAQAHHAVSSSIGGVPVSSHGGLRVPSHPPAVPPEMADQQMIEKYMRSMAAAQSSGFHSVPNFLSCVPISSANNSASRSFQSKNGVVPPLSVPNGLGLPGPFTNALMRPPAPPSLKDPRHLLSSCSPGSSSSLLMPPQQSTRPPIGLDPGRPRKHGKWCDMHVQIARKIAQAEQQARLQSASGHSMVPPKATVVSPLTNSGHPTKPSMPSHDRSRPSQHAVSSSSLGPPPSFPGSNPDPAFLAAHRAFLHSPFFPQGALDSWSSSVPHSAAQLRPPPSHLYPPTPSHPAQSPWGSAMMQNPALWAHMGLQRELMEREQQRFLFHHQQQQQQQHHQLQQQHHHQQQQLQQQQQQMKAVGGSSGRNSATGNSESQQPDAKRRRVSVSSSTSSSVTPLPTDVHASATPVTNTSQSHHKSSTNPAKQHNSSSRHSSSSSSSTSASRKNGVQSIVSPPLNLKLPTVSRSSGLPSPLVSAAKQATTSYHSVTSLIASSVSSPITSAASPGTTGNHDNNNTATRLVNGNDNPLHIVTSPSPLPSNNGSVDNNSKKGAFPPGPKVEIST